MLRPRLQCRLAEPVDHGDACEAQRRDRQGHRVARRDRLGLRWFVGGGGVVLALACGRRGLVLHDVGLLLGLLLVLSVGEPLGLLLVLLYVGVLLRLLLILGVGPDRNNVVAGLRLLPGRLGSDFLGLGVLGFGLRGLGGLPLFGLPIADRYRGGGRGGGCRGLLRPFLATSQDGPPLSARGGDVPEGTLYGGLELLDRPLCYPSVRSSIAETASLIIEGKRWE